MTTVYGVTMNGARRQIERQLKAIGIDSDEVLHFSLFVQLRIDVPFLYNNAGFGAAVHIRIMLYWMCILVFFCFLYVMS